jgi:putative membrane protein
MIRFALPAVIFATPAIADSNGSGHMMGWGYGAGMMFGPVLWLLVLGLVVVGVIWIVRRLDHGGPQHGKSNALEELDLRLARGEIEPEEYSARRELLGGKTLAK